MIIIFAHCIYLLIYLDRISQHVYEIIKDDIRSKFSVACILNDHLVPTSNSGVKSLDLFLNKQLRWFPSCSHLSSNRLCTTVNLKTWRFPRFQRTRYLALIGAGRPPCKHYSVALSSNQIMMKWEDALLFVLLVWESVIEYLAKLFCFIKVTICTKCTQILLLFRCSLTIR